MTPLLAEAPARKSNPSRRPLAARFQTSRATLFVDRSMTHLIKAGGIGIIAAVFGIFLFILWQIWPLFQGAHVEHRQTVYTGVTDSVALGSDEWAELPFLVSRNGVITFIDVTKDEKGLSGKVNPAAALEVDATAFYYSELNQRLTYGTASGETFWVDVLYKPVFEQGERHITGDIRVSPLYPLTDQPGTIVGIAQGESESAVLVAAIQDREGKRAVVATLLERKVTLFGTGDLSVSQRFDLGGEIFHHPEKVLVNSQADEIFISTSGGHVYFFKLEDGNFALRQVFRPFEDLDLSTISSMNFLLGEVSLVFTNPDGVNRIFSLFIPEGRSDRLFDMTKEFPALPAAGEIYNRSLRNKSFLIGADRFLSLRHGTTEKIRWEENLPFRIRHAILGRKYDRILVLDQKSNLHIYNLDDHHPEAGIKAFFGKVWYEGYSEPGYEWQSTGGTDEFEPKLSLVPLIIGTLKGTFYALLFALPIALIAALYTSQFSHPRFKLFVKPTMEIMASLPSVVLGFLAALWLAPIMETRVPSLILAIVLITVSAFGAGWAWTSQPIEIRKHIQPGYEWIVLLPVLLLAGWAGWQLGPVLERYLFVVTDPATGQRVADFRLWWPEVTGTAFEQRNSLVVGFIMGFAVIPIIFTIAEDALSNVPKSLVSGSLALGASRWQTAIRVIVPTAFPGIFSAVMIGVGRAVGETMIVVMATGNTPIMDFNIFSGMRTLSANIAVELPEAPHHGTLYRTLFLGAMVLFLMTFFVNTIAEVIRQRFREKYKVV